MRRLSVLKLSFTLLLSRLALARSIYRRADLPVCAQPCFLAAVEASGCPTTDAPCICDSQSFYESLMPCVLTTCSYYDVAGLLNFGLAFCNRTGINSVERLNGAAKLDTESSSVLVETPTEAPSQVTTQAPTQTPAPATTETADTTPEEPTSNIVEVPSSSASKIATSARASPSPEPSQTPEPEPQSSITAVPPGRFTVDDDSSTAIVNILTIAPSSQSRLVTGTAAQESTSAPPTPTADEPSSASAISLHNKSFNAFVLCLFALFWFF